MRYIFQNQVMYMNNLVANNFIEEIELKMLEEDDGTVECPLEHRFSEGVYIREITMPADSYILGHKHTTTHMNILSKGACVLADMNTGETTTLIAPCTFESKAGVQKLLYIVEECVWSTIHVTEETDIDKLEAILIEPSRISKIIHKDDGKYIRR